MTASRQSSIANPQSERPRWARDLDEKTWTRIGELLDEGYGAADIARGCKLPGSKLRSLQVYARKFGPKRRLIRYGDFKDALLERAGEFGEDLVKALTVIAARAIDPDTKPELQIRALGAMNEFATAIGKMMKAEDKLEHERAKTEGGKEKVDPDEVTRRIQEIYGITPKSE